jgi:hypothetical protein
MCAKRFILGRARMQAPGLRPLPPSACASRAGQPSVQHGAQRNASEAAQMNRLLMLVTLVATMLVALPSHANLFLLQGQLTGAEEVPPTGSPATGFGTVLLDDQALTITVDLSFSGLVAPSTAAHLHEAPFGVNGPIEFPLNLGAALGQTAGAIPRQVFPLTEGQDDVEEFLGEEYYFNVHSTQFPNGETRGQVLFVRAIPEPAGLLLLALAGVGLLCADLTRRRRAGK